MDSIERWGDDIESAVNLALNELKASRDEVDVEVLEQPSKGFFGIGSKLAHVRVTKKKNPVPEETLKAEEAEKNEAKKPVITKDTLEEAASKLASKEPERRRNGGENRRRNGEGRGKNDRRAEKRTSQDKRERNNFDLGKDSEESSDFRPETMEEFDFRKTMGNLPEVTEHPALDFLNDVFQKMGLTLNMVCHADDKHVLVDISGVDTRTIIGKRGQTLDALQYLTSLVVNKNHKEYVKVVLDAENYRARRQKTLENLAERLAKKAVRTGRNVRLEPMNPYERKVIHSVLQNNPRVTTRSEGQDPYRRVIIELKK